MAFKKDMISGMFNPKKEQTPAKKKAKATTATATVAPDEEGEIIYSPMAFKIPKRLHSDLRHLAEAKGVTLRQLITEGLEEMVKNNRKELDKIKQLLDELGVKEQ